ncbi:unnamed protein product [Blepharisma stoltei]|uniref:Uncharacterized protein n=1 Tax=Blepharisma stoltei TaxID=1481888 RepID=A0AAU9K433_9CILI|nr:unnamed protein product [Blepharisma stoltei]
MAVYSFYDASDLRWRKIVEKERDRKSRYPWVIENKANRSFSRMETRACTPSEFPSFVSYSTGVDISVYSRHSLSQDDKSTITDALKFSDSSTQTIEFDMPSPKFNSFASSLLKNSERKINNSGSNNSYWLASSSPIGRKNAIRETDRGLQQSLASYGISGPSGPFKESLYSLKEKSNIS